MIVRSLPSCALSVALLIWSPASSAECDISDVAPTGVLPTPPPGQTFSFVATNNCGTIRFTVPGSGLAKFATRGAAVAGMHAHEYTVVLTAGEWRSVTGTSVTNFQWTVAARAPGGGDRVTTTNPLDSDHDGWTRSEGDLACDHDPARNPGIPEDCSNGIDDDCDGAIGCAISFEDADATIRGRVEDGGLETIMVTGDLDADGTADLLLANDTFGPNQGEAYVVYGPSSGATSVDDLVTISATVTGGRLGNALAAGDADGDGVDDALIGAYRSDRAYLFLGPITAGLDTADASATFEGTPTTDAGTAVAVVPDFDGDGWPDVAIAAPRSGGSVYVLTGLSSGTTDLVAAATYVYEGRTLAQGIGRSIGNLGDANGDGIDDLAMAVGHPSADVVCLAEGGSAEGAYVVEDAAFATLRGTKGTNFGGGDLTSLDYDGDGTRDLIVGAYLDENSSGVQSGVVYGFLGPLLGNIGASEAPVRWESSHLYGHLGAAVAAGDCDADGSTDVVMGEPNVASQTGVAYVQLGFASGVVDVNTLPWFSDAEYEQAGASIALIPDWTGDGGSEIAIGVPYDQDSTGERPGAVYVFSWDPF